LLCTTLATQPDVLFGPYGNGPMLMVERSCTHLIWNHGGSSSRFARPSFPQVINVLSPASTYFAEVLHTIHSSDPMAQTVSLFHRTAGFGRDVAEGATLLTIPFEPSHALETIAAVPESDILLVAETLRFLASYSSSRQLHC
jgi:branched-chain amino acid transport system substrate-binding protein